MTSRTAIALMVFVSFSPSAGADTLVLDNGRELQGVVVEETNDSIVFKLQTGSQITLPSSSVQNLVRSDTSELLILQGDALFDKEKFEEAYEVYRKALEKNSPKAAGRIEEIEGILEARVEGLTEGLNLDEAEERIRKELAKPSDTSPYWGLYRSRLSQILVEKGRRAMANFALKPARKYFAEAWSLDPEGQDFGEDYFQALLGSKSSNDAIVLFLEDYNHHRPGNQTLTEELVARIWKHKPCEAADHLVGLGTPKDTTNTEVSRILPQVFRSCFYKRPFPETAALPRTEYYEIYLELEPQGDRSPLFEARIEEDPNNETLYSDYANYLVEAHRSEDAAGIYRRLLEVYPNSTEASEFLKEWGAEKERMAFQDEVARLKELEKPYQLAAGLTEQDFPLINDPVRIGDLIKVAREISSVLENRPEEMEGEPSATSMEALKTYEAELNTATAVEQLKNLLSQTRHLSGSPDVGDRAPDFTLSGLEGNSISLSDFSGKVVLLYFWATWCPPCRNEAPFIADTHEALKDKGFRIIGVSLDTSRSDLADYLMANPKINWPQAFDGQGWETPVARVYGVRATPSSFLIDKQGTIRYINPRGPDLFNGILQLLSEGEEGSQVEVYVDGAPLRP
ncbi:MAG: redoxin domain-containing protein [Candidatus Omnitrophica bacterium]|nr:redoxin domain-containing protein [Candidatus Omnitrophota bacterium]